MGSDPSYGEMEAHLVACIHESLSLYLYDNAQFLCERLVAAYEKQENRHLLATCYLRSDQVHRAYSLLLGNATDAQSRYLLAQCCMRLGKLDEAREALNPDDDVRSPNVPMGAAGYYLMGKISVLTSRHDKAIEYYSAALTLDPLLWCAYEELCNLGADAEAEGLLKRGKAPDSTSAASPSGASSSHGETATPFMLQRGPAEFAPAGAGRSRSGRSAAAMDRAAPQPMQSPTHQYHTSHWPSSQGHQNGLPTPDTGSSGSFVTPPFLSGQTAMMSPVVPHRGGLGPPGAPGRGPPPSTDPNRSRGSGFPLGLGGSKLGALRFTPGTPTGQPVPHPSIQRPPAVPVLLQPPAPPQRGPRMAEGERSPRKGTGRLFSEPASSIRRGSRVAPAPSADPMLASGSCPSPTQAAHRDDTFDYTGAQMWQGCKSARGRAAVLSLLQKLGEGYRHLCMYRCNEAIEAFGQLPDAQYSTGWVLCCIGRAYYENVDYLKAAEVFKWARQYDPARLQGLEVYSTVLWHLKREVELAHLAQEALAWDRRSPHAWTIAGNCFSLQKEHETALRFFQRALQLDPAFPYAFTLCGHEYFANEDFDRAKACYNNAIRLDRRHYNAWYGIGQIEYRQEKFEMAAHYFKCALNLNGRSSVLRCNLGMAVAKMGNIGDALAHLDGAIAADPKNPLARFERAGVLLSQEHFPEALAELQDLQELAPGEASVYFQMGKLYKRLGQLDAALKHLSHALDLRPASGDANLIKAAIEKLRQPDEADEEEM